MTTTWTSRAAELLTSKPVGGVGSGGVFDVKLSHACISIRVFCCTWFDSGLYIWLSVICFVSWWWAPVIHGGSPGHLRSTAVDSSEIESSSRSVTMSSLRSWLGRQPSKPLCWGDFMNSTWGHKYERTWKLCWGGGNGTEKEYISDNNNNHGNWKMKETWAVPFFANTRIILSSTLLFKLK